MRAPCVLNGNRTCNLCERVSIVPLVCACFRANFGVGKVGRDSFLRFALF